jgi:hypothetical protein
LAVASASACAAGSSTIGFGLDITVSSTGWATGSLLGQEGQQLAVDLLGVGDAHDVRAAVDLDVAGVGQGRVQAPALTVDREDPVGRPVQDQRGDVDALDVLGEVVQPAGNASPGRVGRGPASDPWFQMARTVSSLTRLPR